MSKRFRQERANNSRQVKRNSEYSTPLRYMQSLNRRILIAIRAQKRRKRHCQYSLCKTRVDEDKDYCGFKHFRLAVKEWSDSGGG